MKFSFFPPIEGDVIIVDVTFPLGTPIEVTNDAIDRIQKAAVATDDYFQNSIDQRLYVNTLTPVGYESINSTGQTSGPGGRGGVYT